LGLQDLEKALGVLSQVTELHVSFYACPPGVHDMSFRSMVKRDLPHTVLEAHFEKWDKRPSLSNTFIHGYLRGQWSIIVYPVARVRRALARRVLIDALPSIREWFSRTRPESWYYGEKLCELRFDP
jgi:hypothetical protein